MTLILVALALLAVLQPTRERRLACCIVTGAAIGHDWIAADLGGMWYYTSAALADLFVLKLISRIRVVTDTALKIIAFCLTSIGLNAAGWLVWLHYGPPVYYDVAMLVLYGWLAVIFTHRGPIDDMGHYTDISRCAVVYRYRRAGVQRRKNHTGQA